MTRGPLSLLDAEMNAHLADLLRPAEGSDEKEPCAVTVNGVSCPTPSVVRAKITCPGMHTRTRPYCNRHLALVIQGAIGCTICGDHDIRVIFVEIVP